MKKEYSSIVELIDKEDWIGAIRGISVFLAKDELDEELAILAATVFISTNNYDKARNVIEKGFKINSKNYELWLLLGQTYAINNINQAYLCYENALFYCSVAEDADVIRAFMEEAECQPGFEVRKTAFAILSYNSLDYTKGCIESIRETCAPGSYEIIVVDNASKDDSVAWLKEQKDVILQANDDNAGFPAGCNQCIDLAEKNSDIFLLNNDTVMAENSLFWLRMALYENENVGAVGSVSNSVSNLQQVRWGCKDLKTCLMYAHMNNQLMDEPYAYRNWLIGFAELIKRPVLDEIGGYLDERFTPGQFEDNDLGMRINDAGYRCVKVKNSFIYHYGSGGGKNSDKWMQLYFGNKAKFESKYGFTMDEKFLLDSGLFDLIKMQRESEFSIMDIGCGIGFTAFTINEDYPNAKVYGIEHDKGMVSHFPQKLSPNLAFFAANSRYTELPVREGSMDVILVQDRVRDQLGYERCISQFKNYLKTDGRIIINELITREEK